MFDPSKLDLNLDEIEKKDTVEKVDLKEKIENTIEKTELKEKVTNSTSNENNISINKTETLDILDNFLVPDSNVTNGKTLGVDDILEVLSDSNNIEANNQESNKLVNWSQENSKLTEEVQEKKELDIWKTEYEKNITSNNIKKDEGKSEQRVIFDININSLDILLSILIDKWFDFATFEPTENYVKIDFRKDKIIKETKFIKYQIYTNILLKAKSLTKLTIEETENEQEWEWDLVIKNKNYKIVTKVVPSNFWSKLFIKAKEQAKSPITKEAKKISLSKILAFLWIIAFISLVVWWAFIVFIVMNAKTVDDVKFFANLWINLNDINQFVLKTVTIIFSILIFIETLFLIIYLIKLLLTKKEFKQKKVRYWIIAIVILLLTFATGTTWMIIDKKIRALPNWQEMAYGDVQIFDNSKLTSSSFDKEKALLQDTSNLIWPSQIKFDLSFLASKEERKWIIIKKYIWDLWDDKVIETPIPTLIHDFKEKWNYKVKIIIEWTDSQWNAISKEVEGVSNINITYVVNMKETKLNNWWKLVEFDASSLKELGKIEWYFMDNLNTPVWTWENFKVWKPIFEETLVWMYIKNNDKKSEELDKLFVISWEDKSNLDWKITYERSIIDDLEFELKVENVENDFWKWFIEEYKWIIWDKEITKEWDVLNPVESSKLKYTFDSYWQKEVSVILKDSSWETKKITTKIDIPKKLQLSMPIRILNEWKLVENVKYEKKLNEYFIDEIWVPTELTLDARFVKSNNLLYTLKKVSWDYNSDWDVDDSTKTWKYSASTEWNHTITAILEFVNRKISDDIIIVKEKIYIEWIKKEAILSFDINKNTTYVPVTVSFDASKSQVKNENIEKFIWSYWDWVIEERDAIVPWHKYTVAWEYEVKLKVITTSWKEYFISKSLILKPKPQTVKINTSMFKAPIWQWIDFSSTESEWQIVWYFWDFWDWNTSIEANPTHSYKKAWKYKVILKIDFSNKNILEDTIDIEITE